MAHVFEKSVSAILDTLAHTARNKLASPAALPVIGLAPLSCTIAVRRVIVDAVFMILIVICLACLFLAAKLLNIVATMVFAQIAKTPQIVNSLPIH